MSCRPNNKQTLDRIPSPESDLIGWSRFVNSISGSEVMGGFVSCAELANSGVAATPK